MRSSESAVHRRPLGATLVHTPAELGEVVRASRVGQGVDQVTTAGLSGVGVRFLGELERGKATLRLALVLQVLERLGLDVWIVPRGQRPPSSPGLTSE